MPAAITDSEGKFNRVHLNVPFYIYHASSANYIWKIIGKWNIIYISSNITFSFFILLRFGFEYVNYLKDMTFVFIYIFIKSTAVQLATHHSQVFHLWFHPCCFVKDQLADSCEPSIRSLACCIDLFTYLFTYTILSVS